MAISHFPHHYMNYFHVMYIMQKAQKWKRFIFIMVVNLYYHSATYYSSFRSVLFYLYSTKIRQVGKHRIKMHYTCTILLLMTLQWRRQEKTYTRSSTEWETSSLYCCQLLWQRTWRKLRVTTIRSRDETWCSTLNSSFRKLTRCPSTQVDLVTGSSV